MNDKPGTEKWNYLSNKIFGEKGHLTIHFQGKKKQE